MLFCITSSLLIKLSICVRLVLVVYKVFHSVYYSVCILPSAQYFVPRLQAFCIPSFHLPFINLLLFYNLATYFRHPAKFSHNSARATHCSFSPLRKIKSSSSVINLLIIQLGLSALLL